MNIYEVLVIVTFVMCAIMLSQYIHSELPKLCDLLQIMNILPCYEIKAFKNGKRIKTSELIHYINSPVKVHEIKEGILYIEIY